METGNGSAFLRKTSLRSVAQEIRLMMVSTTRHRFRKENEIMDSCHLAVGLRTGTRAGPVSPYPVETVQHTDDVIWSVIDDE